MKGPIHPGELLLEELLERGFIPNDFAERYDFDPKTVLHICEGETSITQELAEMLAASLGTTSDLWLNLQRSHDEGRTPGDLVS